MKRSTIVWLFLGFLAAIGYLSPAISFWQSRDSNYNKNVTAGGGGGGVTFTPLHTFFMAANGNDACNGQSTTIAASGTCAWATPNHSGLVCGDVILANAGTYTGDFAITNAPTVCPSTTAGIDGAGGIYGVIVLCAGTDLEACKTPGTVSGGPTWIITANNWFIQGFKCLAGGADHRCFETNACASNTTQIIFTAYINDMAINTAQGYDTNECAMSHNTPGNGEDYWAVVGSIAQNAALDTGCVGAIDAVGVSPSSTTVSGNTTRIYEYGNFAWSNSNGSCGSDAEALYLDTPDAHGYHFQAVFDNNMTWNNQRFGWQLFDQAWNTGVSNPTVKFTHNTDYANNTNVQGDGANGDIMMNCSNQGGGGCPRSVSWAVTVTNNISYSPNATSGTSNPIYAATIGGDTWASLTFSGNIFLGAATTCASGTCDSGSSPFSVTVYNSNGLGSNTISNPTFSSTANLNSSWLGAPTCTGFDTVTKCMGYNPTTAVLTPNTPIADLAASCGSCSGKGYQLPSTTCNTNADFPIWLKGVVRLKASGWTVGATITQLRDLVTVPCGL